MIDRNADIHQMVNDTDCANHCMGANAGSIGIDHVGSETDSLVRPQAAASAEPTKLHATAAEPAKLRAAK